MNNKCQALDSDGRQCKFKASRTVQYYGDNEIYSSCYGEKFQISWVKINVCKGHYEEWFRK